MFSPCQRPATVGEPTTGPLRWRAPRRGAWCLPACRPATGGGRHTHFTFQQTNSYRDRQRLKQEFDHLLNLKNDEYTKAPVEGPGDAAVLYYKTNGVGVTLWLRRADFKVWISGAGSITNWSQDARLQDSARNLDQKILK